MKKIILSLFTIMLVMQMRAADYDYLTFQLQDGTEQSVAVSGLRLTFSNGVLTAVNAATSQTITLSQLSKMYFSATTGVQEISSVSSAAVLDVYSASGMYMGRYADAQTLKSSLPAGMYVIKTDGTTYKTVVK